MNTTTIKPNTNTLNDREALLIYESLKLYGISLKRLSDFNKATQVETLIQKVKGKQCIIERKKNRGNIINNRPGVVNAKNRT